MSGLKLVYSFAAGAWEKAMFSAFHRPVADAATDAVFEAGQELLEAGRANIAAAGFSKKWQNGLRLLTYPRGRKTVGAAAWVYHKFIYAHIFETGGTIPGKPLMWLPTSNAPKRIGSHRFTPRAAIEAGIKLFSFKNSKGTPLLGAKMKGGLRAGKTSLASLRKAAAGAPGEETQSVALFFGIPTATIRDRFQIAELAAAERVKLPSLYFKRLKGAE